MDQSQPTPVAASPSDMPSRKSCSAWMTLLIVSALATFADLLSKSLAFRLIAPQPVEIDRAKVLELGAIDPTIIGRLLPPHDAVKVIPGLLDFTLVLNPGAVFGMGPGKRVFFMLFTLVAAAFALFMFAFWTRASQRITHAAIGLLIAGGIGNFYDRMTYGCVRDFIHPLPGVRWPFGWRLFGSFEVWPYVSNVADLFLIVGIGVLAVHLWRHDARTAQHKQPATT